MGGAMFLEGNTTVQIVRSTFQNNIARRNGGAITASGFNKLTISGNTKFSNN